MLAPLGERLREFGEEWLPKLRAQVQKLVDWFLSLNKKQQDMVIWIGIAIALIPVLALVLGSLGFVLMFVFRTLKVLLWPLRILWNIFKWLWGLLKKMKPAWQWLRQQWDKLRVALQKLQPYIQRLGRGLSKVWSWVVRLWRWFKNLRLGTLLLRGAMALLTNPIGLVILAIMALVAAVWLLVENWDWLKKKSQEVWDAIWGKVKEIVNKIKNKWNELKRRTAQDWEKIKSIIKNKLENIRNNAGSWGYNIVKSLANGMLSGMGPLGWAVRKVSGLINSYLGHHSPTEKGPGRYSDQWAPNLMNMYAAGIEGGIPRIQTAVTGVARVVATGLGGQTNRTTNYNVNVNAGSSTITDRGLVNLLQRREWFYGRG